MMTSTKSQSKININGGLQENPIEAYVKANRSKYILNEAEIARAQQINSLAFDEMSTGEGDTALLEAANSSALSTL